MVKMAGRSYSDRMRHCTDHGFGIWVSRWGAALALCALVCGVAAPRAVWALDDLSLDLVASDDDGLRADLLSASVLFASERDGRTNPQDILAAAEADYAGLLEVLYANARYGARISITLDGREAAEIPQFSPPDRLSRVAVLVTPGPEFRFGEARIAPLAEGTVLPDGFAAGKDARATAVREAVRAAVAAWRDAGHATVDVVDQSVAARHAEGRLDVSVTLAPGRLTTFGEVTVSGDTAVRDGRIRQIAGIPRGETFDPEDIADATARLRRTGIFRSVRLEEGERVGDDGLLDVDIAVSDREPRRIGAGLELSTQQGLTVSGFWLHRNILGGAERFRIEGQASQLGGTVSDPDFSLDLLIEKPAVYGPLTRFLATASIAREDEPDFLSRTAELSFGVSREFSDTLTGDLALALRQSETRLKGTVAAGQETDQSFTLLSLRGGLTWDRRDDRLNPTTGTFLQLALEPFTDLAGGDAGGRFDLDARAYRPLGEAVTLAGRLQFGSLVGPDGPDAPPDFLYYSGGSATVRGQPYQSLDATYSGTTLGGRSFVGLSGEVRYALRDNIGLVGFVDAGYVGPESLYDGSGDWHSGAGLGLRYDTTIGPLRLDLAGPVGGDTGEGLQVYLGIGQAF